MEDHQYTNHYSPDHYPPDHYSPDQHYPPDQHYATDHYATNARSVLRECLRKFDEVYGEVLTHHISLDGDRLNLYLLYLRLKRYGDAQVLSEQRRAADHRWEQRMAAIDAAWEREAKVEHEVGAHMAVRIGSSRIYSNIEEWQEELVRLKNDERALLMERERLEGQLSIYSAKPPPPVHPPVHPQAHQYWEGENVEQGGQGQSWIADDPRNIYGFD